VKKTFSKLQPGEKGRSANHPNRRADRYWKAVLGQDAKADGNFFYSVKTTGVYCRPSCASRTPLRKNVDFHLSCAEAESAGFRPCKRCQPNQPRLEQQYATIIARACRLIKAAGEAPALSPLARAVGMSPFHFHRTFKKIVGLTPKAYAVAHRAERIRMTLPKSASVTEAIYAAGFKSNGRFYAKAGEALGMTPGSFRKGGDGATIRFALDQCSLGTVLVASSQKGVCAIFFGEEPQVLTRELQDRFPKAHLIKSSGTFKKIVSSVVAFVENPRKDLDLPLDVRGTAFQQKVWNALRTIPLGKTASYTEIAKLIGRPASVRAVAGACAANSISLAIPCHRVVRHDGNLSGYRWGVERKRALLLREAAKPSGRS
jgi:AraC family transcriptional regulator of adaptative response/methylated-DNA-[protein]-cysteine methyltransferase